MGKVIYLTGAPATGKSTLCQHLSERSPSILAYSYSKLLRDYINGARRIQVNESDIRRQSGTIVTSEAVRAVDGWLVNEVQRNRSSRHIIIDSHAVTKEHYGFRVTPFSKEKLCELAPDAVVCLYAAPEVLAERIVLDPAGRPLPTMFELGLHVEVQSTLAAQYSVLLGKPLYLIDSAMALETVVEHVMQLCGIGDDQ